MNMAALLPLAGIISKKIEDLTAKDLQSILTAVKPGAVLSDDLRDTAFSLLRAENIDKVADILSRPDLLKRLALAVTPPPSEGVVRACGHCGNFNMV